MNVFHHSPPKLKISLSPQSVSKEGKEGKQGNLSTLPEVETRPEPSRQDGVLKCVPNDVVSSGGTMTCL